MVMSFGHADAQRAQTGAGCMVAAVPGVVGGHRDDANVALQRSDSTIPPDGSLRQLVAPLRFPAGSFNGGNR